MAKKEQASAGKKRTVDADEPVGTDFLAGSIAGEFTKLSRQLAENLGTVCGLAISNGGYFGVSVSDDGVACRLVIRRGALATERRYYRTTDLEAALAIAVTKLKV